MTAGSTPKPSRPHAEALKEAYADQAEALAMLRHALVSFVEGDAEEGKYALRSLVMGRMGFEGAARETGIPARSLNRMLSADGNPSMSNLALIYKLLHDDLGVKADWSLAGADAA
ncbi:MAG: transcriptional regulator [Pseudomonadota bacterium]